VAEMTRRKVKWGVIGSGGIARRRTIPEGIVPAVNSELTAVFDVSPSVNEEVARTYDARPAKSMNGLLESDIDAVYIATPANLHFDQAIAATRAGKHVLCEKPLGMTVSEAKKMMRAADSANVILGTGFMMRFQSQHRAALDMITQGRLGTPVYGRAQLSCWYPPSNAWRQDPAISGGGALIDMGGHCIDLLSMYFGAVAKVSCIVNNSVHDYRSEDSAVALLFYRSGAMGVVDTFFCIPDDASRNVLEIYGSRGSILAQGTIGQNEKGKMYAFLQEADTTYDAQQARAGATASSIAPTPVNTYRAEIGEFSSAILEGRRPSNSAQLGLDSQRVLSACYRSARSGRTVRIH